MRGDNLRHWFEIFAGATVHRGGVPTTPAELGWLNVKDVESCFRIDEHLNFDGRKYNPSDRRQKEALFDAIINNARALCFVRLLERRRRMSPPSLDYRVTAFGRWIDGWGYGSEPGFRKRAFFFTLDPFFWTVRHWKLVGIVSAVASFFGTMEFYSKAWKSMSQLPGLDLAWDRVRAQIAIQTLPSGDLFKTACDWIRMAPPMNMAWPNIQNPLILAVISFVAVGTLGWLAQQVRERLDRRAVIQWLRNNTNDEPNRSHVDTATIAKGTCRPEDRVRRACMADRQIYRLAETPELWSIWRQERQSVYSTRGLLSV